MKNTKLLFGIFISLLSSQAQAQGLGISVPQYVDVLPINGAMECRFPNNPTYGFLFKRSSELDVSIEVIVKDVNEGEKTRKNVKIDPSMQYFTYIYLQSFSRSGDFGSYTEFRVENMANPFTLQFMGAMMFTEAYYERGPDGKEKENLHPVTKVPLICKTL